MEGKGMAKEVGAWVALLLFALLLLIMGFQGSLGRVTAVAFAPSLLVVEG
jgi:branched-subunit amino acid permease